jgi:CubicO group peptidase (beta-lactamase class C family)
MVEGSRDLLLSNAVEAINGLRFALPPRKQYQYCNIAIHLVGQIVACISGMLFEDFVKLRILEPLDMEDTTWSFPKAGRGLVRGYVTTWKDDKLRQKIDLPAIGLPRDSLSAAGGGMLSTAGDMSKWLAFLLRLAKGVASDEDKAILRPETLRELLRSRVIANQQIGALSVPAGESLWEEMSVPTYALAQLRGSYRGIAIASHNGGSYQRQRRMHLTFLPTLL